MALLGINLDTNLLELIINGLLSVVFLGGGIALVLWCLGRLTDNKDNSNKQPSDSAIEKRKR